MEAEAEEARAGPGGQTAEEAAAGNCPCHRCYYCYSCGAGYLDKFTVGSYGITPSTEQRTPLPQGSVHLTGYYTDELGWIKSPNTLESGMIHFYDKTGVQPYLYLTDTVDGTHSPTEAQLEAYTNSLYNQLFTDEAHILVVFFEYNNNGHYMDYYVTGTQANTVIDPDAGNILLDYIDRYYYNTA